MSDEPKTENLPATIDTAPPPPGLRLEIKFEELQKRVLFLAVPMYGGACQGIFAKSVMDLSSICVQAGVKLYVHPLFNESLIPRARNYCVDEFMRSDATHLLFIDSDIGFNPQDVLAMLYMASDDSPYDIIGGAYPKKCISWEKIKLAVDKGFADENPENLAAYVGDYVFNPKPTESGQVPIFEPVEVLEIGTGFMLARRNTFDKFKEAYPQYSYKPDHVRTKEFDGSREIMQYFQAEIDGLDFGAYYEAKIKEAIEAKDKDRAAILKNALKEAWELHGKRSKRYLSEDYWFCQKAQAIGLKTYLCPWIRLQHAGTMIFGGSLIDLANLGAPATVDPAMLKNKK